MAAAVICGFFVVVQQRSIFVIEVELNCGFLFFPARLDRDGEKAAGRLFLSIGLADQRLWVGRVGVARQAPEPSVCIY